jgi:hypothetical protein
VAGRIDLVNDTVLYYKMIFLVKIYFRRRPCRPFEEEAQPKAIVIFDIRMRSQTLTIISHISPQIDQ